MSALGLDLPGFDAGTVWTLLVRAARTLGAVVSVQREFLAARVARVHALEFLPWLIVGVAVRVLMPLVTA